MRPLGQKLVAELGLHDSVDTLSKWIAHYVADRMERADKANELERPEAERQAFEAILDLWRNHHRMPNGRRPFEEIEPVIEVLRAIDPARPHFYRTEIFDGGAADEADRQVKDWLNLVIGIDYSARILIEHSLSQAVAAAGPEPREWMALVRGQPVLMDERLIFIEGLVGENENASEVDEKAKALKSRKERVEERIKRLNAFVLMADQLRRSFEDTRDALESEIAALKCEPDPT